jgi:predicted short-subunit dehydrogenase-like oxidoreductase (DUF2520 family)
VNTDRDGAGGGTTESLPEAPTAPWTPPTTDRRPRIGIVGAGAVGTALGVAINRAGWPVVAVASRDASRRDRFCALVLGAQALAEPAAMLDIVDLIIIAVPDDAIAAVAAQIRLRSGQGLVHTSGALGAEVLAQALAEGGQIGSFHPLVSFTADVERSVSDIAGAAIAIEGDDQLVALLADLATAIGGTAVRLQPGAKAAYHAAAVMASGGLVALLDAVVTLGAKAGLDEHGSLEAYGRLMEQTLANARAVGVGAALTGPIIRGDVGTVAAHVAAIETQAPDVLEFYLAAARRQLRIAEERGSLLPDQAALVGDVLAKDV